MDGSENGALGSSTTKPEKKEMKAVDQGGETTPQTLFLVCNAFDVETGSVRRVEVATCSGDLGKGDCGRREKSDVDDALEGGRPTHTGRLAEESRKAGEVSRVVEN